MKYNPDIHRRRSIRLKGYDYSQAGAYFVTLCAQNRQCIFGNITDERMALNDAGRMVQTTWNEIPDHYPGVDVDAFVVMPNHIHGIVIFVGAGTRACPDMGQPQGVAPTLSLPDVVHRFKTMTTKRYTDGVKQSGWPPYPGKLWQRNYYEHIIRLSACDHLPARCAQAGAQAGNENELNRIREYIQNNLRKWEIDRENPAAGAGLKPARFEGQL
jgi:REP element-mobilizing transposase RayT